MRAATQAACVAFIVISSGMASGEIPSGTPLKVQNAPEKPSDTQLQTAVAQAMQTSPLTANSLIIVHVNQGEVTLEGAAVSPLARREATRLAETVLGVTEIRNRLSVVNAQTAVVPPEQ
ncbi:MAG TPA: BON domain-containing protein [Nitrospira sp.]